MIEEWEKPFKKVNPILKEFKAFAMRGNVIDLAVGVVIGAAFGKIVSSIVTDLVTPLLGMLTGKVNFKDRFFALDGKVYENLEAAKKHTSVLTYGSFIQNVIDFLIIAFVIFLVVRLINKVQPKPGPPPAAPTKDCPFCISKVPLAATKCAFCTSELTLKS